MQFNFNFLIIYIINYMLIICFSKSVTSDEFNISAVNNINIIMNQHQLFNHESLFWDITYHVIICTWCEHAVELSKLIKYLQKFHNRILSFLIWKKLEICMSKNQIIKKNNKIKIHLAEQQDFFSHLIIYYNNYVCLHADCNYISLKSSMMKKHLKKYNNI